MGRTATAILSTENLLHNLKSLKEKAPHSKIISMVKANAYGHGLRSVSQRLQHHTDMLGVASIDEALALRKAGVNCPILLAEGVFEPSELLIASAEKFHVVFHDASQLEWLDKIACPQPILAWLKINTGMGRLGFGSDETQIIYQKLSHHPKIAKPIRIMSHFACADDKHHKLNQFQIDRFNQLIAKVKQSKNSVPVEWSFCNSGGIYNFPDCHFDFVRPGIALYGVSPFEDKLSTSLNLKPVMTLQSSLISLHQYSKGSTVGYGARYTCPEDMLIGVVAFGYGDGYPITAKDGTPVLVNNVECPLVGRVSMDMLTVDLRNCHNAKVGDPVVLWGEGLPIEKVVKHTANIVWDLLTGVQNRVKFLWTRQ